MAIKIKEIHGKPLHITEDGGAIYYNNIQIMCLRGDKVNEHTDLDFWINRIENNPNFCSCKASNLNERHPRLVCKNYPCNK